MSAQKKTAQRDHAEPPIASPTTTKEIHQMSTETIAPALAAPEGFTPSEDEGYWDGPAVRVDTEAAGTLGAQAQWTPAAGVTYALGMGYNDLTGTEVLRLAAALNSLVLRSEYPNVGQS